MLLKLHHLVMIILKTLNIYIYCEKFFELYNTITITGYSINILQHPGVYVDLVASLNYH